MLSVVFPTMQDGQARPLEKQRSFRARLHTEALPLLLVDEPLLGLRHRQQRASLSRHDPNRFGRGDRQGKPVLMVFQPGSQVQIVAIHSIGDDPGHGDLCLMHAFHHRSRQLTLRLKADSLRNTNFFAASAIFQPVARKIEFPVEQRVAKSADVGEKDPDLTILDLFGAATILTRHSCRLVSPLGKAGLVDGHHCIPISEVGQDIGAQFVTDAVLVPDGIGEEALHAIGAAFSGLFGELPSIFARHITQDALEVQEATTARWRREQNREPCVRGEIVTRLPNGSRH
jgi:hypothetical protein